MRKNLIASAESKENSETMVNEYHYSKNYIATNKNKAYNKKNGLNNVIIMFKNIDGDLKWLSL